jgi:undecaprenyl pyrophosphate phosphatase UppP
MDTSLQNRISLGVSTGLSLLFILLITVAAINGASANAVELSIVIIIGGAFCVFLLFNIQCYAVLKANKETKPLPQWIQKYGTAILVFTIIAIVVIAFMFIAATAALVTDSGEFPIRQKPFFIVFLALLLMSIIFCIQNIRQSNKEKKKNKAIVNSIINTIGEASSV